MIKSKSFLLLIMALSFVVFFNISEAQILGRTAIDPHERWKMYLRDPYLEQDMMTEQAKGLDSNFFEYIGSGLWSGVNDIKVQGAHAFVGYGPGLEIYDISEPTDPVFVNRLPLWTYGVHSVVLEVLGDFVYAGVGYTLYIIDVTDIQHPFIRSTLSAADPVAEIKVRGDTLYVLYRIWYTIDKTMEVYDITDKDNPELLTFFIGSYLGRGGNGLYLQGDYAYIASCFANCLWIIDISDLSSLLYAGGEYQDTIFWDVVVSGDYAYLVGDRGLTVLDVSDTANIQLIRNVDVGSIGAWSDMVMAESCIHFQIDAYTVKICDVSDPAYPQPRGQFYARSLMRGLDASAAKVYVPEYEHGFTIEDVANPYNPYPLCQKTTVDAPQLSGGIDVAHNHVYVSGFNDSFYVADISNPEEPLFDTAYSYSGNTVWVLVDPDSDYVYVSGLACGTYIYDLVDPARPNYLTMIGPSAQATKVRGNIFYGGLGPFDIWDITDRANPELIVRLEDERSEALDIEGDYAYIFHVPWFQTQICEFHIFDISDSSNPVQLSSIRLPDESDYYTNLVVRDDIAYVPTAEPREFIIIDVSDKYNPSVLSSYRLSGVQTRVCLYGNYALVSALYGRIHVVDVSLPASPQLVHTAHIPGAPYGMKLVGETLFVSADQSLLILRINFPPYPDYLPGDANGDSSVNAADVVFLINYLFKGGEPPHPMVAGDLNCDGTINSADVIYLINYLFKNGPPPGC